MIIAIFNRQKTKPIRIRPLRSLVQSLGEELDLARAQIGIHLVTAGEMTQVNETYLNHAGSTDVITFDHAGSMAETCIPQNLYGELFVCVDEALLQARRFNTSWQAEVTRYIVHGILHLLGYDDRTPHRRKLMKQEENRLVRCLLSKKSFASLSGGVKLSK